MGMRVMPVDILKGCGRVNVWPLIITQERLATVVTLTNAELCRGKKEEMR